MSCPVEALSTRAIHLSGVRTFIVFRLPRSQPKLNWFRGKLPARKSGGGEVYDDTTASKMNNRLSFLHLGDHLALNPIVLSDICAKSNIITKC